MANSKLTTTVFTQAGAADRKHANATMTRDKAIVATADMLQAAGATAADVKPGNKNKRVAPGEHYESARLAFAKGRLTKAEYTLLTSDAPMKVKSVYTPRHKLNTALNNAFHRFMAEVVKAMDAMAQGASASDVTAARKEDKASKASKAATARHIRPLDEYLAKVLADAAARVTSDKVKPKPTGKAHAEITVILKRAAKEIAALSK